MSVLPLVDGSFAPESDDAAASPVGAFRRNAPVGGVGSAAGVVQARLRGNSPNCTELALEGAGAVVIVTEGEGSLNGLAVRKGDRLVAKDECVLAATGTVRAVVCFGAKKG